MPKKYSREARVKSTVVKEAQLRKLLQEAVNYEREAFEDNNHINGADLVEWFAGWRLRVEAQLDA